MSISDRKLLPLCSDLPVIGASTCRRFHATTEPVGIAFNNAERGAFSLFLNLFLLYWLWQVLDASPKRAAQSLRVQLL